MSKIYISAAHKSSGKTTVSIGLCAALREKGLRVQPFKKGPDYIDPLWLGEAAQRPCYNLDFYTQDRHEIQANVQHYSQDADLTLIEGNKGLFDGMALDGHDSNAALAQLLDTPVVLVLDTRGMTRGIAPLVLGYQNFHAPQVKFAGIILNRVGGARHESKLRAAVEHYTDLPVLGALHEKHELHIVERHLGLMPSNEDQSAQKIIANLAAAVHQAVDLDVFLNSASPFPSPESAPENFFTPSISQSEKVRLAILRDQAFGFYYPGDLDALEKAGATLLFVDALHDNALPEKLDGIFIGGGFPETQMHALAANHALKNALRDAVETHLPVYAECGGLMYLGRRLSWGEEQAELCGALPLDTRMGTRPQGRGYVHLQETGAGLWPLLDAQQQPASFYAHEFHYSCVETLSENLPFAYNVLRGHGIDGKHDGLIYKHTLANYVHLRDVANNHWAARFVAFIRQCKAK